MNKIKKEIQQASMVKNIMKKTIISINRRKIDKNRKHNLNEPVIRVQKGKEIIYHYEYEIVNPSKIVYNAEKPLKCGARVWIETLS